MAASIPQEHVPTGPSEHVQDILGQVAMECNVEFMLSDKMLLAYGSWQEVEKARTKLTEVCSYLNHNCICVILFNKRL